METNGAVDTIKGLPGSSDPFAFILVPTILEAEHQKVLIRREEDLAKHWN
jgi:hypothetical protein